MASIEIPFDVGNTVFYVGSGGILSAAEVVAISTEIFIQIRDSQTGEVLNVSNSALKSRGDAEALVTSLTDILSTKEVASDVIINPNIGTKVDVTPTPINPIDPMKTLG